MLNCRGHNRVSSGQAQDRGASGQDRDASGLEACEDELPEGALCASGQARDGEPLAEAEMAGDGDAMEDCPQ